MVLQSIFMGFAASRFGIVERWCPCIFCACLDQPASRLQHLAQTLCGRRLRAERFHFTIGSISLLVDYSGPSSVATCIEPSRLQFCYGSYGKPVLAETFAVSSISTCLTLKGLPVCYYSWAGDWCWHWTCPPVPKLSRSLTASFLLEKVLCCVHLPATKPKAFFRWTRKEAI